MIQLLHAHRSIRRFTDEPVEPSHLMAAVSAGQKAATSSAVQAYCAIRVTDPEHRITLASLTGPQEKVRTAPEFLVICGDVRRHRLLCERERKPYAQRLEGFLVAMIDATLFAQNLVIAIESLGYGTCYIGGLRNHLAEVVELLQLPEGVYPVYGLCIGRPAEDPEPRPRLEPQSVLFDGRYPDDAELLAGVERYDQVYREYLRERGVQTEVADRAWSGAMVGNQSTPTRSDLAAVYRQQGAKLD